MIKKSIVFNTMIIVNAYTINPRKYDESANSGKLCSDN